MAEYTLKTRLEALKKMREQIRTQIEDIAKGATMRAVEKATELTPPTMDDLSGTNTRSGALKQHWATDSKTTPQWQGNSCVTELNNNMNYASYVNDGHRMDRHFVPGLVINEESGMLEYNPDGKGGIVVGTQTSYVPGLFMTDKAKQEYSRVVKVECDKLAQEVGK